MLPAGFAATLMLAGEGAVRLVAKAETSPVAGDGPPAWTTTFEVPREAVACLGSTTVVSIGAPLPRGDASWGLYGKEPVFLRTAFACFARPA